jgi:hypothetical protein
MEGTEQLLPYNSIKLWFNIINVPQMQVDTRVPSAAAATQPQQIGSHTRSTAATRI